MILLGAAGITSIPAEKRYLARAAIGVGTTRRLRPVRQLGIVMDRGAGANTRTPPAPARITAVSSVTSEVSPRPRLSP